MPAEAPVKPEQMTIDGEGFEIQRIKEIDDAADLYVEARDERIKLSSIESDRKKKLAGAMHTHGQKEYHYEDASGNPRIVKLVAKAENVKVLVDNGESEDIEAEE